MNIVTNNFMLRYFKSISLFKIDLGKNLKGPAGQRKNESTITIRDEFVKKYQSINKGKIIMKYGEIGSIKFYEDGTIGRNTFHIYDKDQIFEIEATNDDLGKDATVYLTEILQLLEDGVDETIINNEDNMIKDVAYTNMPENMDRPNMNLPKDQYMENLLNRRKLMEKINKQK